jgi:hypothetical protein
VARLQVIHPVALRKVIDVDGELVFTGDMDVPNPAIAYAEDHPMVRAYPWAFAPPEEVAARRAAAADVIAAPIEQATAAPGERRGTRRPRRDGTGR